MLNDADAVTRNRSRAELLRSCAATVKDKKLREEIESWANEYDRMAELAQTMQKSW